MTDLLHIIHCKLHNTKHIKFIRISADYDYTNTPHNQCGGTGTPQDPWRYNGDKISIINEQNFELYEILIINHELIIRSTINNRTQTLDTIDLANPKTDIIEIIAKINKLLNPL